MPGRVSRGDRDRDCSRSASSVPRRIPIVDGREVDGRRPGPRIVSQPRRTPSLLRERQGRRRISHRDVPRRRHRGGRSRVHEGGRGDGRRGCCSRASAGSSTSWSRTRSATRARADGATSTSTGTTRPAGSRMPSGGRAPPVTRRRRRITSSVASDREAVSSTPAPASARTSQAVNRS